MKYSMNRKPKAIALMSGGLDSTLAAKVVRDQGVEVIGLHLLSPFGCREDVEKSANAAGVPLHFKEKGEAYLDLVQNPRYGYGKNMNPCIDCRIFMFQLADVVRQDERADFIVTGEVLGQRPMSQQRNSMELIDRQSPVDRLVLRPLSAHCLAPTIPEENRWIDREKLFQISGRSRKEQMALAEQFGIKDYSSPGGGCLLTESAFSARLRDFFDHKTHQSSEDRLAQSELLGLGRHFRISDQAKVIVGRDEKENEKMNRLWSKARGTHFTPDNFDGPSAILIGKHGSTEQEIIGAMIARYGKGKELATRIIRYEGVETSGTFVAGQPIEEERLNQLRL